MTSFLLLQLSDGTFPSGGFAHSSGLEATAILGGLRPGASGAAVSHFLDTSLRQLACATLPYVRSAAVDASRLAAIDDAYDATLAMRVPNEASRAQGRALAIAVERVWSATLPIAEYARGDGAAHHGPVFGAIFGALAIGPDDTVAAYLHGAARGILSAAVRLSLVGPLEAQAILAERASLFDVLRDEARTRSVDRAAQTAPLLELFASLHDRLDGRMFQS